MEPGDGSVSFSAVVPTTFKREDYKRTKHDAVFSNWQVLIGSNDWEDFKNGKDSVGRYRVHNLPRKSYPGLYELGVSVITNQDQGLRRSNLDDDDVLVAYLGQAENVRSRLQKYGRSGAHLGNNLETTGLFEDVFSKQGSILYRCAQMGSKREAEATEGMLLSTFDYAWNKGSNGERRQLDLLEKLGDREFMRNRKSGIEIKRKLSYGVVESDDDNDDDKENFLSASSSSTILKTSRSRPQQVLNRFNEVSDTSVCGVMLENGGFCEKSPVKRRKRCEEHKGQRICRVSPEKRKPQPPLKDSDSCAIVCGVILPNMVTCNKSLVSGRKRCEEHKGMRVNAFLFLLNQTDSEKTVKDAKLKSESEEEGLKSGFCEAMTKKGLPCTRSSPKGSKRCWQHDKEKTTSPENSQTETVVAAGKQVGVVVCGVKLGNGLSCERSPRIGCKRRAEHKGMRIAS